MSRVSVVVPCFNSAATVASTLDSLRSQTFKDWEGIVVNDGSTDGSTEIIERYRARDPRIKHVFQTNQGLGAARNAGLERASGELVSFLDTDDLFQPTMLERLVHRLQSDSALDVAFCDWIFSDPTGIDRHWIGSERCEGQLFGEIAHRNPFPCHSLLLRRRALDHVGAFDTSLKHCHDWDLWLRVARTGARFGRVPEPLVVYRMLRVSLSRSPRTFFEVGAEVLRRAHRPDPRVTRPASGLEDGCRCAGGRDVLIDWLVYCVGLALAQGNQTAAAELVDAVLGARHEELTPARLKPVISALHFGTAIPWKDRERVMTEVGATLLQFLVAEELKSNRPGFAMASAVEIFYAYRLPIDRIPARAMLAALPQRLLRRLRGGAR